MTYPGEGATMKARNINISERAILKNLSIFLLLLIVILAKPLIFKDTVRFSEETTIISQQADPFYPERNGGPDLEISTFNISIAPEPIRVGDTGFITAEVFNIGSERASFINITFNVDSTPLGSPMILPHLMANSGENVTKMWQPSFYGNHTIQVILDEGDHIQELNESNNEASIVVFVATAINIPPTVNITYPVDHERVSGTVIISGTAHDSAIDINNLTQVEVRIDGGEWQLASGRQAWEYQWNTIYSSEGLHNISARAYDGEDHSSTPTISVIVDNDISNRAPVANISSPRTGSNFTVNRTIRFQGNESSDPDDGPEGLNFTWDMGDGTILHGANVNYSYSEIAAFLTVTLRVYDGDREDSDSIQLFIDNTPPVAVAGENRTAEIGENITFNGSRSYDPDPWDEIEDFTWDMGNGDLLYGDENGIVEYTYTEGGGQYEVTLTVTDTRDASGTDSLIVTLNNTLPVAILELPSREVRTNKDLYFNAVDSYDPDGEVVEYYFDFGDGDSTGWTTSVRANHTYFDPGEYAPRLKVKDAQGGISLWNCMDITVLPEPNRKPVVEVISPLPGAVIASPLIVEGTSSDPDAMDTIRTVEITISGNKILAEPMAGSSLTEWTATLNISVLENGEARLKARSFDGKEYSDYHSVNVEINNDEPQSIVVRANNISKGVFKGESIEILGEAKYDTGVAVAGANVTLSFIDEKYSGITDRNGLFSFAFMTTSGEGEVPVEIRVEKNRLAGVVEETILIYRTDFSLVEDSIKLYRGEEEIVGYNDAPRDGETVELRVKVLFYSDAMDGPAFTGYVNVSQVIKDSTTLLLENESISFTPDGREQSSTLMIEWTPGEGSNTIMVNIAADRDTSPGNNSLSRAFTVREKEYLVDFLVTDIKLPEGDILEGVFVTVAIEITNNGNVSGFVNVSLYENKKNENNLIERRERIFLKTDTHTHTNTIPIKWKPTKAGYLTLFAVLDSSLEEEEKEYNRTVEVYPREEEAEERSHKAVTVAVIGIILVIAAAIWVFYRRKEEEENDESEEDRSLEIDEYSDYEEVEAPEVE